MEKKLHSVEQLPEAEASKILALPAAGEELEADDTEVEEESTESKQVP